MYYSVIHNSDIKVQKKSRKAVTAAMREYCVSSSCRRNFLKSHFGEEDSNSSSSNVDCCDICDMLCDMSVVCPY